MSPAPNGTPRALVTGARGQLGTALTKRFSDAGWSVLASARPGAGGDEGSAGSEPLELDLRDDDQIERAAGKLLEGAGDGDRLALVCNATTREPLRPWAKASREDFHQLYDVDVVGHFLLARAVASGAIEAGASASIVLVASIYGVGGVHPQLYPDGMDAVSPQYVAAKGALVALARDLAGRWGRDGVRVNAVVPGGISRGQDPSFVAAYEQLTQLGRMAEPEEVAEMVEMLSSERASYVTGQAIGVDGGWTAW